MEEFQEILDYRRNGTQNVEKYFVVVEAAFHCTGDWVQGPIGNCYKFVNDPKVTWSLAQSLCAEMGGALVRLESWIEIYSIRGYRTKNSKLQNNNYWIGGYKTAAGKWVWKGQRENNPINTSDWAPGEPNNFGGVEGCVHLIGQHSNTNLRYKWNDISCNHKLPFICEKNKVN